MYSQSRRYIIPSISLCRNLCDSLFNILLLFALIFISFDLCLCFFFLLFKSLSVFSRYNFWGNESYYFMSTFLLFRDDKNKESNSTTLLLLSAWQMIQQKLRQYHSYTTERIDLSWIQYDCDYSNNVTGDDHHEV